MRLEQKVSNNADMDTVKQFHAYVCATLPAEIVDLPLSPNPQPSCVAVNDCRQTCLVRHYRDVEAGSHS